MSEHYCQYTADNHDKTHRPFKQCGQSVSIEIAGRWFCGRHVEALAS